MVPRLGGVICPSCSRELPGEFSFCPSCGIALAEAPLTMGREERKVVTVLFADLVGFTARAEQLDPEDVRALLSPYHAHLRTELERFGGTVEKFIGDAVMALFGAPVAHEDDPERAVRAALAIRDWAREQGEELQVRIAVNTGRGAGHARRAAERGRGDGCRRRRQHRGAPADGCAAQRSPRRRAGLPGHRARDRLPQCRAGGREGEERPDPCLGGVAGALSLRRRRLAADGRLARRPRPRARAARLDAGARAARSARRSWSRSSACPGSARADSLSSSHGRSRKPSRSSVAPGSLAPLRRGRHLLGAGRDRQGAGGHLRERLP